MRHVARFRSFKLLFVLFLSVAASSAFVGSAAAESDPAVREANFRVGADYTWTHLFSDEVFQFRPGPTARHACHPVPGSTMR